MRTFMEFKVLNLQLAAAVGRLQILQVMVFHCFIRTEERKAVKSTVKDKFVLESCSKTQTLSEDYITGFLRGGSAKEDLGLNVASHKELVPL